ncbi:MAG: thiamine ABC transporter substrate-binding protein, partial [Anaerolineales bacterium]
MKKLILLLTSILTSTLLSASFLLSACISQATPTQPAGPQTITVMTHDSFSVSEGVVRSFEEANNAKVVFLQSGDAGAVLNKAILTKDAPLADLLFGVDNTFLSRALEEEIFDAYES